MKISDNFDYFKFIEKIENSKMKTLLFNLHYTNRQMINCTYYFEDKEKKNRKFSVYLKAQNFYLYL